MARNLYILAGTLMFFAGAMLVVSFLSVGRVPGNPGDVMLWRTMSIAFFCLSLMVTLAGMLTALFEQAERRAEGARAAKRGRRQG